DGCKRLREYLVEHRCILVPQLALYAPLPVCAAELVVNLVALLRILGGALPLLELRDLRLQARGTLADHAAEPLCLAAQFIVRHTGESFGVLVDGINDGLNALALAVVPRSENAGDYGLEHLFFLSVQSCRRYVGGYGLRNESMDRRSRPDALPNLSGRHIHLPCIEHLSSDPCRKRKVLTTTAQDRNSGHRQYTLDVTPSIECSRGICTCKQGQAGLRPPIVQSTHGVNRVR